MTKYEEQQVKINEIIKRQGNFGVSLPLDFEHCDECEYRDKEWESLLGERLIREDGSNYFLRSDEV